MSSAHVRDFHDVMIIEKDVAQSQVAMCDIQLVQMMDTTSNASHIGGRGCNPDETSLSYWRLKNMPKRCGAILENKVQTTAPLEFGDETVKHMEHLFITVSLQQFITCELAGAFF